MSVRSGRDRKGVGSKVCLDTSHSGRVTLEGTGGTDFVDAGRVRIRELDEI